MMVRRRVVSINDRVAHRLVRIGHLHLGTDTPARSLRKAFSHGFEPVKIFFDCGIRRSDAMPWKRSNANRVSSPCALELHEHGWENGSIASVSSAYALLDRIRSTEKACS